MDRDNSNEDASNLDIDIADTNYAIYRDALAAVLIDKLSEPAVKPKRKQRKRAKAKKVAVSEIEAKGEAGPHPEPEPEWEVVELPEAGTETLKTLSEDARDASPSADPSDDLAEFVDYLARETFDLLPADLRTLAHHVWVGDAALRDKYGAVDDDGKPRETPAPLTDARVAELLPGLDPSPVADSMQAYGLTDTNTETDTGADTNGSAAGIVAPALSSYLAAVTAAPPPPRSTRDQAAGCEVCGRDWVPLGYHHLIPRFVHAKVVKRGWHRPDELQNVAWLCGACHRQVHRFADHETLARQYYTVERLLAEPEMQRFAAWASRLRWKGGRG